MNGRLPLLVSCAIAFFIGFFFVRFDPSLPSVIVSNIFVICIAVPSFAGALQWLGVRRGLVLLVVMGLTPLLVEGLAIITGFPYGEFTYSANLGPRLLGLAPFIIMFAYLPLLLGAVTIAWHGFGHRVPVRILASTFFLLLIDLVIDPASVHTGIWTYEQPGVYYGVPISNFVGWLCTGVLYTAFVDVMSTYGDRSPTLPPPMMIAGCLVTLSLWSGYLSREMLVIPAVLGALLVIGSVSALWVRMADRL